MIYRYSDVVYATVYCCPWEFSDSKLQKFTTNSLFNEKNMISIPVCMKPKLLPMKIVCIILCFSHLVRILKGGAHGYTTRKGDPN